MYPKKFEDVIQTFHKLPSCGLKTAERYAFAMLDWDQKEVDEFVNAIQDITKIKRCKVCGNLSEENTCSICADAQRDHSIICVVQTPKDITVIESMQEFDGVYHVLNGTINTAKGILPDHLNIDSLLKRIDGSVNEVILALDPTMEGETTSLYISRLLDDKVKVTHLAHGIPMGSKLDYTDARTLSKAFHGRR
jgi:recombination protein RecR